MRRRPPDEVFEETLAENDEGFFVRFGREPDYSGKRVLDLGCGHGALVTHAALHGADAVLGVDLDEERIAWAQENVPERYPEIAGRVRFETADVRRLDGVFDLVLCKNTMEHIDDVAGTLAAVRRLLTPGGEFWVGFSPLYYSPFGDHRRTGMKLPWLHGLVPWN